MRRRPAAIAAAVGLLLAGQIVFTAGSGSAASPVWSIVSFRPKVALALSGVSCVSATSCEAVGEKGNNSATFQSFGESWNGHVWSVVPSGGPAGSELTSVSCVSPAWCQAVGSSASGGAALTESWNGHRWSVVAGPKSGSLTDVSCVSRTFCMAAGTSTAMWDGRSWVGLPNPDPANVTFAFFDGVSCVSRQACVAVGQFERPDQFGVPFIGQYIESWNGKAWSIVPAPRTGPADVVLNDVSCVSTSSCVAVGLFDGGGPILARTLVERWDGKVWSVQASPNRGDFNELFRISCVSAMSCQAVGGDDIGQLIEAWNGRTWSMVPIPGPARANTGLRGVSCVSPTSCKAVGYGQLIESYG